MEGSDVSRSSLNPKSFLPEDVGVGMTKVAGRIMLGVILGGLGGGCLAVYRGKSVVGYGGNMAGR